MLKDRACTHTEGWDVRDVEATDLYTEGLKGNGVVNLRSSILAEWTVPDEVQDKRIATGMAALHEEHGRKSGEESEDDGGEVMVAMMNIAIIVRFSVIQIFRMIPEWSSS